MDERERARTDDSVDLRDTREHDPRDEANGRRFGRVVGSADDMEGVDSVLEDGLRRGRSNGREGRKEERV